MQNNQQIQVEEANRIVNSKQTLHQQALKQLVDDQSIRITLRYCQEVLKGKLADNITQYSPIRISQHVLQPQLQRIKTYFTRLPNGQCKIEHFLIIMVKVMQFPFQKIPYYLIGFKDMFYEIVDKHKDVITYQMFFKYILGEIITLKEEQQQNTEFQVRFQQQKKQDYLLHDTGIQKMLYIKDLKIYVTLDENAYYLKIYNMDMKIVNRIIPSKDKHYNKHPIVYDFDYCELAHQIGLLLSDGTITILKLQLFIKKQGEESEININNEITLNCPSSCRQLMYLQMINRWLGITQKNTLVLFDSQKYKQQVYYEEIKLQKDEIIINKIIQIVPTNTICLISKNEVIFYNQKFTQKKWTKFSHPHQIINFHYCQERNKFYLAGNEKIITILQIVKHTGQFKISIFDPMLKSNILKFQVFPFMNTIVLIDDKSQLKIYNQVTTLCQHSQSFKHIVKNQKKSLNLYKINKIEFSIFETYILMMTQTKQSIEKEVDYNFEPYLHFDKKKQNLYMSVNHQIISFSIMLGEIRKNYSKDTSNLESHQGFMLGDNTNIFVLDRKFNLYELYFKDQKNQRENRNYKKKLLIESAIKCFYEQVLRIVIVVSNNSISQIINQGNNNFNTHSTCVFEEMNKIVQAHWRKPIISVLTFSQLIYQLHYADYSVIRGVDYRFPKDPTKYQDGMILSFDHDYEYGIDIILNNLNELYFVSVMNEKKTYYVKLRQYLPFRQRDLNFTSMKYQKLGQGKNAQPYLILYNELGYFGQFQLKTIIKQFLNTIEKPPNNTKGCYKVAKTIDISQVIVRKVLLVNQMKEIAVKSMFKLVKAHDKAIQLVAKIQVQFPVTITISKDGFTKLWNNRQCLFSLKLPNLTKTIWNMSKIEQSKNQKSIKKITEILSHINFKKDNKVQSPVKILLQKSRNMRNKPQNAQINFYDPIKIEFQNKQLQEIIYKTQNTTWISSKSNSKQKNVKAIQTSRVLSSNNHPWRKNKQLLKIISKATPTNQHPQVKMPKELFNMRKSLDMTPPIKKTSKDLNTTLVILPEINSYVPQPKQQPQVQQVQNQQDQKLQIYQNRLHIKNNKFKKRINELDEIDKEFKKKWTRLTSKRWIPYQKKRKAQSQPKKQKKEINLMPIKQKQKDTIEEIQQIFESYNKESNNNKNGRVIKVPNIKIKRDDIFL